ncbi:MAG: hypothetical protein MMC23_007574 [Stictis urceolatum]|nr:hypothetical protein [Stictis urceolata]
MSTSRPDKSTNGNAPAELTYFEQQREALVGEIATSLENVLQNINKLNRSLEGVIAVGNEFGSVEALWSQFENVMAKDGENGDNKEGSEEREEQGEDETRHG